MRPQTNLSIDASRVERECVVVAMSGGVDSSAAAVILGEQGYQVVGVSMQVWDYRRHGSNNGRATCCAPADFDDAREVARMKDFPFYVFDFEDSFRAQVIDPFISAYEQGLTPNPCIECNRKVKFAELRKRAKALGASKIATGHYAQIKPLAGQQLGLFTSSEKAKDQSYFLYALTQEELRETLFPVGGMTKNEVRRLLEDHGVPIAQKRESQDICFVSSSVGEFIEREGSGAASRTGAIVTSAGVQLGKHEGVHNFTVGQRRGLGVAAGNRLYVLDIDAASGQVTVGGADELQRDGFVVHDVNWIDGSAPGATFTARVKVRYRHAGARCRVTPQGEKAAHVDFLEDWSAVCPGQAAVFYELEPDGEGDFRVLGGGTIAKGGCGN